MQATGFKFYPLLIPVAIILKFGDDFMKPVVVDSYTQKCARCGAFVMKAYGTGTFFEGASESYENWCVDKFNFCPNCGELVDRDKEV